MIGRGASLSDTVLTCSRKNAKAKFCTYQNLTFVFSADNVFISFLENYLKIKYFALSESAGEASAGVNAGCQWLAGG